MLPIFMMFTFVIGLLLLAFCSDKLAVHATDVVKLDVLGTFS